ncbi:MAG: DUF721 domain-containing protein [Desulfobacterales bacterium]
MEKKTPKFFFHIADILPSAMQAYRSKDDGELTRIWELWSSAVGPAIAENTRPAAFKGTLLIVHAASSVWMHQLQFLKKDIIEKVNRSLGKRLVKDIKFRIGAV